MNQQTNQFLSMQTISIALREIFRNISLHCHCLNGTDEQDQTTEGGRYDSPRTHVSTRARTADLSQIEIVPENESRSPQREIYAGTRNAEPNENDQPPTNLQNPPDNEEHSPFREFWTRDSEDVINHET